MPPRGGLKYGKAPSEFSLIFEVEFPLTFLKGFLFANVFSYGLFIQSHCADTVSPALEMQPRNSLISKNLPVDSHGTFSFDEPYRKGHTILRRDAETHVYVVRHQMPFHHLYASLPAQIPYHFSHVLAHFAVQLPLPILRYDHHVVFTIPSHVG